MRARNIVPCRGREPSGIFLVGWRRDGGLCLLLVLLFLESAPFPMARPVWLLGWEIERAYAQALVF